MSGLILRNPVAGQIYLTDSGSRFYRSQRFGGGAGISSYEQRLGDVLHFHRAIDIAPSDGRSGVDLLAAAAGKVTGVGMTTDGAKVVVIYHGGGFATGYCHNASNLVSVGQQVAAGQHIAEMGSTGIATGIHVHFILKGDFPASGGINALIRDDPKYGFSGISNTARGSGTWLDPWPHLAQNVKAHPKLDRPVNIRTSPGSGSTMGSLYAESQDGLIKLPSGAVIGASDAWYGWGDVYTGARYVIGGVEGTAYDAIYLNGAMRYIASPLVVRSI